MKGSLVKMGYDDLNPYILDESTRKKLNSTHFVLGEERYRELQNKHHLRLKHLEEVAKKFNVELKEPVDIDIIMQETERTLEYFRRKAEYDAIINKALEVLTIEEVYNTLKNHCNKRP